MTTLKFIYNKNRIIEKREETNIPHADDEVMVNGLSYTVVARYKDPSEADTFLIHISPRTKVRQAKLNTVESELLDTWLGEHGFNYDHKGDRNRKNLAKLLRLVITGKTVKLKDGSLILRFKP